MMKNINKTCRRHKDDKRIQPWTALAGRTSKAKKNSPVEGTEDTGARVWLPDQWGKTLKAFPLNRCDGTWTRRDVEKDPDRQRWTTGCEQPWHPRRKKWMRKNKRGSLDRCVGIVSAAANSTKWSRFMEAMTIWMNASPDATVEQDPWETITTPIVIQTLSGHRLKIDPAALISINSPRLVCRSRRLSRGFLFVIAHANHSFPFHLVRNDDHEIERFESQSLTTKVYILYWQSVYRIIY